jgi:hypothetical protein
MPAPKYHSEILDGETNQDWFYAEGKKHGSLRWLDESDKEVATEPAALSDTPCVGTGQTWRSASNCSAF